MKNKIKDFILSLMRLIKKKEMVPIPTPVNGKRLLAGKTALITGGSGGIGFAIARSFLDSGCKVIIAGTNKAKLEKCCSQLGGTIRHIVLNVLDVTTIPEKIKNAAELFGEKRIDILVNAAGVINKSDFLNTTEEEYDSIMGINAKGTYFMCQAMSKFMIENKIKGHILNVSSSSALRPAWSPYQISKWAVRGFTLGLADTLLPHSIIVNAIAPGPVATPMLGKQEGDSIHLSNNPSGRYAMPSEIAALATFMVSDLGNLIVGDTFYITGGSGTISSHD
jgi:3-oxoacyl-[acyl-carrier protein] reductase